MKSSFGKTRAIVGMIHVHALPGTPGQSETIEQIANRVVAEAEQYVSGGVDGLMIENMHDIPYLKGSVGPEIVAAMTAVGVAVRRVTKLPLGVQILAGANREALAAAFAMGADFIRAENFAYAHVADEGLMPTADAGPLLRYRKQIGAEHIGIVADVKKKHASHAITADLSIAEIAKGAAFFGADAVIVTGGSTGEPAVLADVRAVREAVAIPVWIGSGVTPENLEPLWSVADVFVVGSYCKQDGRWANDVDSDRVARLMTEVERLRSAS